MNKQKVIIFGAGYWGKNIIRCLERIKDVTIVGICDINPSSLDTYKEKYKCFNSLDETLNVDFDIGFVITRAESHFHICEILLKNNKHVFVEKPMALSLNDSQVLSNLSSSMNKILSVDHTFLFSPEIDIFKFQVEQNLYNIKLIESFRVNNGPLMKDINVIWDLCPHDFSILNYIVPLTPYYISCQPYSVFGNIEKCNIRIKYLNSDLTAKICVSWLEKQKSRNFRILGKDIDFQYDSAKDKFPLFNNQELDINKSREPLLEELKHFINCCKINKKSLLIDGSNGVNVIKMIEAAQESARNNGTPYFLHEIK